jgi:hypothetical protein
VNDFHPYFIPLGFPKPERYKIRVKLFNYG